MENPEGNKSEIVFLPPMEIKDIVAFKRRARVLMVENRIAYHFGFSDKELKKALPGLYQAWLDQEKIEIGVESKNRMTILRVFRFCNGNEHWSSHFNRPSKEI